MFTSAMHSNVFALFVFVCLCYTAGARILTTNENTPSGLENSPLTTVQAVVGESALLPCNITHPTPSDAPVLILFFFGDMGMPIYSVDSRQSGVYTARHWSHPLQFGGRATFKLRHGVQGLLVTKITREDAGEYRCRVDFRSSPTKNMRLNLDVVVPPRHILITSSWEGERIVSGTIGPYPEGADLTLTCQVTTGEPEADVTWWEAGALLDSSKDPIQRGAAVTRNSLRLPRLSRDDLHRKLTCIASNNNITAPLSTAVVIDIAFPPSSVRILVQSLDRDPAHTGPTYAHTRRVTSSQPNGVATVRFGRETALVCESSGSRPKALLEWRRDRQLLTNPSYVISSPELAFPHNSYNGGGTGTSFIPFSNPDGNGGSHNPFNSGLTGTSQNPFNSDLNQVSVSTLRFIPTIKDHNIAFSCKATSPKLPNESLENKVILNVLYRPQLELSFESPVSLDNLEEGDDFAFVCHVEANPPAGDIQWARDGVPISSNFSLGVSVNGSRLEVVRGTRSMSGRYTCATANTEGVTTAAPLDVNIKFAPVCNPRQQTQYGAGRKEEILVSCSVESHPLPMSFRWAFNQSSKLVDIAQSSYSSSGMTSVLHYLPRTEADFGSLLCWSVNAVGEMKEPCVIQIVPAAKPEMPKNCIVENNSSMPRSVAVVSCAPGWDGGLGQTFTLEVRESKNIHPRMLASVQHSPEPLFNLKGLKQGEKYLFIVTAVNSRGTSTPVTLSYSAPSRLASTLTPNTAASNTAGWISWTSFVTVVFGVLFTVFTCLCAVIGLMKFKTYPSSKNAASIVYNGTALDCEGKTKPPLGTTTPTMIVCGKADCQEDGFVKPNCIHSSNCSRQNIYTKQGSHEPNTKEEKFRNSESDVRLQTPCVWSTESISACEDSYFRNSGPYHINSLSPPPTPLPNSSLLESTTTDGNVCPCDSLRRSSSSMTSGPDSSIFSCSVVALQPDYLPRDDTMDSSRTPLMSATSRESAV